MNDSQKVIDNIGRRVAEMRRKMGMTQDALAEKAGITGGYIRQIEGGWKNMRITTLCNIADILHCSIRDLFEPATLKKPGVGRPSSEEVYLYSQKTPNKALAAEKRSIYRTGSTRNKKNTRRK